MKPYAPPSHTQYVADDSLSLDKIFVPLFRQWFTIAICIALCLGAGFAYVKTAEKQFTSTANILIDQRNRNSFDGGTQTPSYISNDSSIASQVELIRSKKVALAVFEDLNLAANERFIDPAVVEEYGEEVALRIGIEGLRKGLEVERVERTDVLSISYTSPDPKLAQILVTSFAENYFEEQLDAKYAARKLTGAWMLEQINKLREKARDDDTKVQSFRAENQLFETSGLLVSEQELEGLNKQLLDAKALESQTESQYENILNIIETSDVDATASFGGDSKIVEDLRGEYLRAEKRKNELVVQVGAGHQQVKLLEAELQEYNSQIFSELSRIAGSQYNDLQVATDRRIKTEEAVENAKDEISKVNKSLVKLRELEGEATASRNQYESFLDYYQTTVQQQSVPITEARIISAAEVAARPSHPKPFLIMAFAGFMGGILGAGIAGIREYRERAFRTRDEVIRHLELPFLGNVMRLSNGPLSLLRRKQATVLINDFVIQQSRSMSTETLRQTRMAIDLHSPDKHPNIIGVTSALPDEGKTSISVNMAKLLANEGGKTLLIDGDLRIAGVAERFDAKPEKGLADILVGEAEPEDVIFTYEPLPLDILPAASFKGGNSAGLLASEAMTSLLAQCSTEYDHIVIDLPPIAPVIDSTAIAHNIDAFIYVTEWGKTARYIAKEVLTTNTAIRDTCIGVILNKVDPSKLKKFQKFGSVDYYAKSYTKYQDN